MPALLLALLLMFHVVPVQAMEATDNQYSHPLAVNSLMPDLPLRGALPPAQLQDLGLADTGPYHLSQIRAKHVILVAFSMYCPHCQREAPALNELQTLIRTRGLDRDLKLVGIGIGNSDFEVEVFRKKYAITFPVFADPEMEAHKLMGEVGTPFSYLLTQERKRIRVADNMLGRMDSVEAYLQRVATIMAKGR